MTSIISAILGLWRLAEEGGMFKDDLTLKTEGYAESGCSGPVSGLDLQIGHANARRLP